MATKRMVDTSFWVDSKVDEFSPEDKYFMLYLLTNPFTTQLGIYEISIKQAALQMGYSTEAFSVLLERFESKYHMIMYSKETGEVAIKNFLRHSIVKGGKPVEDCIKSDMAKVKNKKLIDYVFNAIADKNINSTVRKIVIQYQNDNDNDNDNDNEVSYQRYVTTIRTNDTSDLPNAEETKPEKHKYGEYSNVLLTNDELDKLKAEYPDWQARIERLSSYVASTGKNYESHFATIRNWARKDKEKEAAAHPVREYGDPEEFYR